jgi:hypothetical protein
LHNIALLNNIRLKDHPSLSSGNGYDVAHGHCPRGSVYC